MPRRILVLTTAPDPDDELRERIETRLGPDAEVLVVAPASDVSLLQWLANDEDRARAEAARRAGVAASALPASAGARIATDPDPLIAVEDALRTFPADEIVVVTRPEDAAGWLEEEALGALAQRLLLPVTHIVDDEAPPAPDTRRPPPIVYEAVRGESPWSAFVVQNAVALAVGGVALVLIGIAFAVYVAAG
jgi:hypothetical protein